MTQARCRNRVAECVSNDYRFDTDWRWPHAPDPISLALVQRCKSGGNVARSGSNVRPMTARRCISLLGCTPALPFLVTCCFADSRRSFGSSRVHADYAYAVGRDDRAVHVAQQGERERVRLVEGGVAGGLSREPSRGLTQAGQLPGSDAASVVAVEAEDNVVPAELPERAS